MPLFLHIAQGNTRHVAGRKGPAKLRARMIVLRPNGGLGSIIRIGSEMSN